MSILGDAPDDRQTPDLDHRHDCYANGHWNKDGESWVPGLGHCQTCSCKVGRGGGRESFTVVEAYMVARVIKIGY